MSLILLVGLVATCVPWSKPSDTEVIENFRQHRQEIEALLSMMRDDKLLRHVGRDWTDPQDPATIGLAPKRIDEYRLRLAQVGYPDGFGYWHETGNARFLVWGQGALDAIESKAIVYLAAPPEQLVPEIAKYRPPAGSRHIRVYQRIEGNWYLEYSSD